MTNIPISKIACVVNPIVNIHLQKITDRTEKLYSITY